MILLGSSLKNAPVMSIQSGSEIARTRMPVIDPGVLAIVAYEVSESMMEKTHLLRVADVRELSDIGLIVDSEEEFLEPEDVIKLNEIYEKHFQLVGIAVTDEKQRKLGKVVDFTLETGNFVIQQLTVRRPLLKSLSDTELLIHRSQIIEINNDSIVVHSEAKAPEPELHEVVGSYVNPFRKAKPASERNLSGDRVQ